MAFKCFGLGVSDENKSVKVFRTHEKYQVLFSFYTILSRLYAIKRRKQLIYRTYISSHGISMLGKLFVRKILSLTTFYLTDYVLKIWKAVEDQLNLSMVLLGHCIKYMHPKSSFSMHMETYMQNGMHNHIFIHMANNRT